MTLRQAYAVLDDLGPALGKVRRQNVADGVEAGLSPDGTRLLIVEVSEDADSANDTTSRGVWLLGRPSLAANRTHALECRDPRLNGVFTQLAEDAAVELAPLKPELRGPTLRRLLGEWRDLLEAANSGDMSVEEQAGLHGELLVLRRRLEAGATDVLDAWAAAHGRPGPDMRWAGIALEIKASRSLEGFHVRVHGAGQLDPPPSKAQLRLAAVRLVEEPDGKTVPELVDELAGMLDRRNLLTALGSRGYRHDPNDGRSWQSFSLDRISVWAIGEATPRISGASWPDAWRNAIHDVAYTLDLASFGEPLEEEDELWR